jgi:hypothetical protein
MKLSLGSGSGPTGINGTIQNHEKKRNTVKVSLLILVNIII